MVDYVKELKERLSKYEDVDGVGRGAKGEGAARREGGQAGGGGVGSGAESGEGISDGEGEARKDRADEDV